MSSGPIAYPHPPWAVFDALVSVLPYSWMQVVWADRELAMVSAITGPSTFADGLQYTIYVQATGPQSSVVTVQATRQGTSRGVRGLNQAALTPALQVVAQAVARTTPPAPT